VLPAAARLVAHKRVKKAVSEAVWVQNLQGTSGVIWAMKFRRDGNFLACAGQDGVLRVWQTSCSRHLVDKSSWVYGATEDLNDSPQEQQQQQEAEEERRQQQQQQADLERQQQQEGPGPSLQRRDSGSSNASHSSSSSSSSNVGRDKTADNGAAAGASPYARPPAAAAAGGTTSSSSYSMGCSSSPPGPYFLTQPVREYHGHTEDILDISWSAAGFLLSASVDNSVRLWHLTQPDCLRTFWHNDFVTCVQFHPRDAQRFVTGAEQGGSLGIAREVGAGGNWGRC
jgi:WD40 repeat protein